MALRRWRVLVNGVEVARSWSESAAMDRAMREMRSGDTVSVVFPDGDRLDITPATSDDGDDDDAFSPADYGRC